MRKTIIIAVILVVASLLFTGKISVTYAPKDNGEVEASPGEDVEIPGDNQESPTPSEENHGEDKIVEAVPIFPETLTVLDANEANSVNILKTPDFASDSIGVVYGDLMHVEVVEEVDTGFTKISTWDYRSMKPIEGYVSTRSLKIVKPQGQYQVLVSLGEQKTYIYKDGELDRTFINSTGVDEAFTPKGIYLIGDRGGSFYSGKYQQGAYNWVRFNNNYLFHSVPFDATQKLIPEEAAKLGQKASHGCIRHSIEDAQWFYDNITRGTLVVIQD